MRIVMMGTGTFAEPTFDALLHAKETVVGLVTQPDRDSGNKRGSTRQTGRGMAAIAADNGVSVIQPESINTPDGLAALTAFQPDLLVVAAYGQILKPEVIAAATRGAINVHASLLPKYRGASPIAHAILNGETRTGVTIINITPGLDAGDMLAQEAVDIVNETTGELEARLAPLGAKLCLDVIQRMKAGAVSGTKQDPALVTKAPKLKKEYGLIDWGVPNAMGIASQVRAMQPWPTAYTFFHRPGKEAIRVIITKIGNIASFQVGGEYRDRSGMLLYPTATGFMVGVNVMQAIEILELQPAGKKRMTAEEFLRGYPIQDGYRFGPERV